MSGRCGAGAAPVGNPSSVMVSNEMRSDTRQNDSPKGSAIHRISVNGSCLLVSRWPRDRRIARRLFGFQHVAAVLRRTFRAYHALNDLRAQVIQGRIDRHAHRRGVLTRADRPFRPQALERPHLPLGPAPTRSRRRK